MYEFKLFGVSIRLDVLILGIILGMIISSMTMCSCIRWPLKEGMQPMIADAAPVSYQMGSDINNSWINWADNFQQGPGADSIQKSMAGNYAPAPGPQLESGQLFIFAGNNQSPDCCPAYYSGSDGCVCATNEQMTFMNERGGNRTLPTEF